MFSGGIERDQRHEMGYALFIEVESYLLPETLENKKKAPLTVS